MLIRPKKTFTPAQLFQSHFVYASLIRISERWRRISMSDYDLALLKNIRQLYGWKQDEEEFISMKLAA
ncbi:MAG: hypothetical protein O7F74_08920 [Bacteroidetes bacterium]|nr:hypothetical protein [Bacteroidota bacterium]